MFTLNGLYVSVGIVAMLYLTSVRVVRSKAFPLKYLFYMAPFAILSGFLLARLSYLIFNSSLYLSAKDKWKFFEGGYLLYGALIGAVLAVWIWCLYTRQKKSFLPVLDACAPGAALGICIGRLGSVFFDECYGLRIEDPAHQKLPTAVYVESVDSWCMAVFLYEAIACLFIVAAVLFAEKKIYRNRKGAAIVHFAILYAGARTFLESLRLDSVYCGFVRVSQVVSVLIMIALFVTFAVKTVKLRGFVHLDAVMYGLFAASVGVGFWCEFYMGSESYVRNYIILCVCCVVMTLLTLVMYALYSASLTELNRIKRMKTSSLPVKKRKQKLI